MIEKSFLQVYTDLHPRLSPKCTIGGNILNPSVEGGRRVQGSTRVHAQWGLSPPGNAQGRGGTTAPGQWGARKRRAQGRKASRSARCPWRHFPAPPSCRMHPAKNSDLQRKRGSRQSALAWETQTSPRAVTVRSGCGLGRPGEATPVEKQHLHLGVRGLVASTLSRESSAVRMSVLISERRVPMAPAQPPQGPEPPGATAARAGPWQWPSGLEDPGPKAGLWWPCQAG